MSILYSCVGKTDPIRDLRDGPLLHIIRHYRPTKVFLFFSRAMMEQERLRQLYSIPIYALDPQCVIETIDSDIEDVQHLDSLQPLVDHFYSLVERYPDEEILVNLTSGTPQMQIIMATLSLEYNKAKGIQVDTPAKKANTSAHVKDTDSIQDLIEYNLDNDGNEENRCYEPTLRYIRKTSIQKKIEAFIDGYNYEQALALYKDNKDVFPDMVGRLLQHAYYREKFDYKRACECLSAIGPISLKHNYDSRFGRLWEYLLIMDIRVCQKNYQDFFVRMTPFLYELIYEFIFGVRQLKIDSFGQKRTGKNIFVYRTCLEKNYSHTLEALDAHIKKSKNGDSKFTNTTLSYWIMQELLCAETRFNISEELKEKLIFFRKIERDIRNELAHTISGLDLDKIKRASDGKTPREICSMLYDIFFWFDETVNKDKRLIYNVINAEIKKMLI